MESHELAQKLRHENGIEEVWDAREWLLLDNNGVPMIEMWYKTKENSESITELYQYSDGSWNKI